MAQSKSLGITFVAGAVVGVLGSIFVPRMVGPYVPDALRRDDVLVPGFVTAKRLEPDRLLLTVVTAGGTVLATFGDNAVDVDLLVNEGDSLSLALPSYEPFVHDPKIGRVAKVPSTTPPSSARPAVEPDTMAEAAPAPDSLSAPPADSSPTDTAQGR